MKNKLAQLGAWLVRRYGPPAPTSGLCEVYTQHYAGDDPAKAKAIWESVVEGRVELVVNGQLRGWKN